MVEHSIDLLLHNHMYGVHSSYSLSLVLVVDNHWVGSCTLCILSSDCLSKVIDTFCNVNHHSLHKCYSIYFSDYTNNHEPPLNTTQQK